MKKVRMPGFLVIALVALWLPAASAEDRPKKQSTPAPDDLAKTLITQCARVREGDVVEISGGVQDVELLESLTVEAEKRGAETLLRLLPSDRALRRLFTEVPTKYDARTPAFQLKLAETITAAIAIDSLEPGSALSDLPPERLNAMAQVGLKIMEARRKHSVRQVRLGNGLYPTDGQAKRLGITKSELTRMFYDGLNVDYAAMQATGEAVRKALSGGKTARITTPAGTDLTVQVAGRQAFASDGVLSDDKLKKGGVACQLWLPAGEVYVTPVPGTAEGTVVVERMSWKGKEIRGLRLRFAKGKLTEMKAESGLEEFQAMYDASGAGKDEFSLLQVGINPAVRLPKDSLGRLYMEAGAIWIGTGNNVWAGGDNNASFGVDCLLRGGTLVIDGKALVQDGALQVQK
jgi:leucyl aminopeptidase (aminopeptidase T)